MMTATLRPGLLVSLKTAIRGNVSYRTKDVEADHVTDGGERRAVWETERVIEDPREHEDAVKARSKARALITGVCSASDFGLLCPESRAGDLAAAYQAATEIVQGFNATAARTRIDCFIITGRIAADDVEAVRAINAEVGTLMGALQEGIRALDPAAIRGAANRLRDLGAMLTPDAGERVNRAISDARAAAREIVRQAGKAGETAAIAVDTAAIDRIATARAAFLDLDGQGEVGTGEVSGLALDLAPVAEASAPAVDPLALDLDPVAPAAAPALAPAARDFEV